MRRRERLREPDLQVGANDDREHVTLNFDVGQNSYLSQNEREKEGERSWSSNSLGGKIIS